MIRKAQAYNILITIIFLILVPAIFHITFSCFGFNPTDEGAVLAGARRIVEGQIPHRDFISIRPTFSFFLHIPFVIWGGSYTFWLSRLFAWFQCACIGWAWMLITGKAAGLFYNKVEKFLYAIIALMCSVNIVPIMAWHTLDGLFFLSVGFIFCLKRAHREKFFGYAIIGLSYLCKQSFLPAVFISILILGDFRRISLWIAASIPAIVYTIYLWLGKAIPDALVQLTFYNKILYFSYVIRPYFANISLLYGIIAGFFSTYLIFNHKVSHNPPLRIDVKRLIGLLVLYALFMFGAMELVRNRYNIFSFCLFGAVIGLAIYFIIAKKGIKESDILKICFLGLLASWCTSLSLGYNYPSLASGPLGLVILAAISLSCEQDDKKYTMRRVSAILNCVILAVFALSFFVARLKYPYRDKPAWELNSGLGGVLKGANLIRTNSVTYEFFEDLKSAIDKANGKIYAIIPDLAAYWVKSEQVNPLRVDWVSPVEIGNKAAMDNFTKGLKYRRGDIIFIVGKFDIRSLAYGLEPISDTERYEVVYYIRTNFAKIGETKFFELYK